jgi:hypothetical protein
MQQTSRPRAAADREGRRNYLIFCIASTLGLAVPITAVSVYLS